MLSVSEKYLEAISADSRTMLYRVTLAGGLVLDQLRVTNISYDESINDTSGLSLGTANSASLKFTLKDAEPIDYHGMLIEAESGVELSDGTTEYVPLGKFWVTDFSTSDDFKTVNFTCADGMYHMTGAYESELTYPAPIESVVKEIVFKSGVEFVEPQYWPDVTVRRKPPEMTLREAIGYAAGCCGRNARFNREGKLEFVWYGDSVATIPRETQYLNGMTKLSYKPLKAKFEITGQKELYTVKVISDGNGGITATPGENILEGDTVVLSINPFSDYELATIMAVNESGERVTLYKSAEGGYTFIQPDSNVTVTVSFRTSSEGPFKLTVRAYEYGSIAYAHSEHEAGNNYFNAGDTATIFVTPDSGYEIDTLITTPADLSLEEVGTTDEGDIVYEFIFPESDVTINTYFKTAVVYYTINRTAVDDLGMVYIENTITGELISEAAEGTLVSVTFAPNTGYVLDRFSSSNNISLTKVGENTFNFTMPANVVSITGHFKLSEDESKRGMYSWLQTPQAAPTTKPYWAVFYKDDWSVPVWKRFHLVWFDNWSVGGYTSNYGKRLYSVRFEGYYCCGSVSAYRGVHSWNTSKWSGNGSAGSYVEWDVYIGGNAWSGGSAYGYGDYCLLASNTHLFYYSTMLFEKCENAIQSPQTEYVVDGMDVREKGSLKYWKCPDTYSTPAPAANWMIVDAHDALCMKPNDIGGYVGADYCNGLYVVFFDSISVEGIGAVYENTNETFYIARVTNGHYVALPAESSSSWGTLYDIAEDSVLGLRHPLYGNAGTGDMLGAYHFSGILASSVRIGSMMYANSCRICDCVAEASTYSLRRNVEVVDDTVEEVTISYTNPFIYEKMVPAVSALVQDITYTPVKLKHRGNPALQAGDVVIAPDKDGVYHNVLVMQQTMNFGGGMNSEISCSGKTEKTTSFSANSPITSQIKKEVQQSSFDLEHRLAVNNALVFASLYKTISTTEAKLTSVVEWQTEKSATISRIEQTANENEAKISLVVGQNGLVNENGAVQGSIVISAINGESVAKISADRLDIAGKELNIKVAATNITGTLSASQINADGISVKDGTIADWTIKSGYIGNLSQPHLSFFLSHDGTSADWYEGQTKKFSDDWFVYAKSQFGVTTSGKLYAANAEIKGHIEAISGKIGGCTISEGVLQIASANIGSLSVDKITTGTNTNAVTFTNITASGGSVGGWSIENGVLSAAGTDSKGGKTHMKMYSTGVEHYVNANKTAANMFYLVITTANGTPIGGISTAGWQTIYT